MHKLISEVVFLCPEGSGRQGGRRVYEVVSCCKKRKICSHRKLLLVVMLTLTAGGAVAFAGFIKLALEPNMEELAKIRAEVLVSRTVTRVLTEQFQKDTYKDELFTVTKDDEGNMSMVQADSAKINLLMSQISARLQESFKHEKRRVFGTGRSSPGKQIFIADRHGRDHGHPFERICDGF